MGDGGIGPADRTSGVDADYLHVVRPASWEMGHLGVCVGLSGSNGHDQ